MRFRLWVILIRVLLTGCLSRALIEIPGKGDLCLARHQTAMAEALSAGKFA